MQRYRVLISGAGVAGLSLAYWLAKAGHAVTIVERANSLRAGGQAVDFRGPAHKQALRGMGILDQLAQSQTRMAAMTFLGDGFTPAATLPSEFAGGEIEILRGSLLQALSEAVPATVHRLFGDSVTSLEQTPEEVLVTFRAAPPAVYDLVVGADGLRSNIRRLVFGDDRDCTREYGYTVVSAPVTKEPWQQYVGQFLSRPGRCAGVSGTDQGEALRATFFFAHSGPQVQWRDPANARRAIPELFAADGWIVPALAQSLALADTIYSDTIASVELNAISKGRVVLLGDAAHGGTIGGMGTGVAVVGAYVLAHELFLNPASFEVAFRNYHQRMESYARTCRSGASTVGEFFAPKSKFGIWRRNMFVRLLEGMPGKGALSRMADRRAANIDLSKYNGHQMQAAG